MTLDYSTSGDSMRGTNRHPGAYIPLNGIVTSAPLYSQIQEIFPFTSDGVGTHFGLTPTLVNSYAGFGSDGAEFTDDDTLPSGGPPDSGDGKYFKVTANNVIRIPQTPPFTVMARVRPKDDTTDHWAFLFLHDYQTENACEGSMWFAFAHENNYRGVNGPFSILRTTTTDADFLVGSNTTGNDHFLFYDQFPPQVEYDLQFVFTAAGQMHIYCNGVVLKSELDQLYTILPGSGPFPPSLDPRTAAQTLTIDHPTDTSGTQDVFQDYMFGGRFDGNASGRDSMYEGFLKNLIIGQFEGSMETHQWFRNHAHKAIVITGAPDQSENLVEGWDFSAASGNETGVNGHVLVETPTIAQVDGNLGANQARQIEGVSNSETFSLAGHADFDFSGVDKLMIAVRVKFNTALTTSAICGRWDTVTPAREFLLRTVAADGRVQFFVSDDGTNSVSCEAAAGSVTTGTWYDIYAYYDAKTKCPMIIIDDMAATGSSTKRMTTAALHYDGTRPFEVGSAAGGSFIDMDIAKLGIWTDRLPTKAFRAEFSTTSGFATAAPTPLISLEDTFVKHPSGTPTLDDDLVKEWTDERGALSAVNASGSEHPLYVANALNGLPGLKHSTAGVAWLQSADYGSDVSVATEIVVGKMATGFQDNDALKGGYDATHRQLLRQTGTDQYNLWSSVGLTETTGTWDGEYHIYMMEWKVSGDDTLWVDGVPVLSGNAGVHPWRGYTLLNYWEKLNTVLADAVIVRYQAWDRALTTAEKNASLSALSTLTGLPVTTIT